MASNVRKRLEAGPNEFQSPPLVRKRGILKSSYEGSTAVGATRWTSVSVWPKSAIGVITMSCPSASSPGRTYEDFARSGMATPT
jgi:hypothetical protein